jgi:esterase
MKLFFRSYGSGTPIVILHGLYGSSDNWVSIAKTISAKYTVILPDLRNHGRSPHSQNHSYDLMAEDIEVLATELGLRKFLLAGHSMGGRVAMKYAIRWPERINTLVIADISPFGPLNEDSPFYKQHREILETIISVRPEEFTSRTAVEAKLSEKISSDMIRGFIMKNLGRNETGRFEWKLNAPALLENLWNITAGISSGESVPDQITGFPVVFLKGENSEYIDPLDFKKIRGLFPAAEFIKIKNAGHWIHADNPDAVAEILLGLDQAS